MKDKRDYLTPEEILLIKEQAKVEGKTARNYMLVSLLEHTACRISEVLHIRVKDVFLSENMIRIGRLKQYKKLSENTPKIERAKWVEIPMHDELKEALETYIYANNLNEHPNAKLIYGYGKKCRHCNLVGHLSRRQCNNVLKKLAKDCGLDKNVHVHQYRHSWVVNGIKSGKIETIAELIHTQNFLGHSDIRITMIYWNHFGLTEMKEFINK
jgi:integrase